MKCQLHDCEKEAVRGSYCEEHWKYVMSLPDGGDPPELPEDYENEGQFPY